MSSCAQVIVMRQEVEGLRRAMRDAWPVHTTETMAEVVKALRAVGSTLSQIDRAPALRLTPQQHAQTIAQDGEGLVRGAVQQLERAAQDTLLQRNVLSAMIETKRGQREQFAWLIGTRFAAPPAAGTLVDRRHPRRLRPAMGLSSVTLTLIVSQ